MLNKNWPIDKLFLFTTIQLISYGTLVMYSASSHLADIKFDNHLYYLTKHLKWIIIGIVAYQISSRIKFQQLKTIIPLIVISTWSIICIAFYFNPTNGCLLYTSPSPRD